MSAVLSARWSHRPSATVGRGSVRLMAALCVAGLGGASCSAPAHTPSEPAASTATSPACESPGTPGVSAADGGLPELHLPCLGDGPSVDLASLTGRPTLINLWASWCAPCREEMPRLVQAFADNGDAIRFLGINTRDEPAAAREFAAEIGVPYPHAVDADGALLTRLGLPGLPVTLGLDPAGRVVATQIGPMDSAELAAMLARLKSTATPTAPPPD